jgi:hypothetical protein
MMGRRSTLAALVFAVSVAACQSDPGAPRSIREVVGHVVSPHGDDGAVVLEIAGRGIEAIEADSARVFVQRDGGALRVVLVRATPGTIAFRLRVLDRQALFNASVTAVANGANQPRPSLDGYRVAWVR